MLMFNSNEPIKVLTNTEWRNDDTNNFYECKKDIILLSKRENFWTKKRDIWTMYFKNSKFM